MLSQIIRFALPQHLAISAPEFLRLRQKASTAGATAQYYGHTVPTQSSALPMEEREICWVIQWPEACNRDSTIDELLKLAIGKPVSLLLRFTGGKLLDLDKALAAPVCEFACIRLSDNAPLLDAALQQSMEKTYTDTYQIDGFTGGQWAYATNTNESSGEPCGITPAGVINEQEQRLGVYCLGWESIEHHERATKTPVFAEEIVKLLPHFGPGTGAWYVKLETGQ